MQYDLIKQVQDEINKQLFEMPAELSNKRITELLLEEWRGSNTINDMITANAYYLCKNVEIAKKKRVYKDEAGGIHVNEAVSNQKVPAAFIRSSVNQKINYGFGKPFVINVEGKKKTEDEKQKDPIANQYLDEWQGFINTFFRKALKRVAKNAVNNGIGWAYVWINDDGQLKIADVDSETIYPQWKDRAHTMLEAVVRDYEITDFATGNAARVKKVEYWDDMVVERYIDNGGGLIVDVEGEQLQELPLATAHMAIGEKAIAWGKVPFISLKGNEDELPLLNLVKDAIDAYDLLQSKSVDTIVDDIDAVVVYEGMSAEIGSLIRARELLKNSLVASVEQGGGVTYLKADVNIDAIQKKLEHLRKDIREYSCTVDTQDIRFGNNPSGVALKAMYQDLDIFVNGLEVEFEVFMENLKYFFDRWLEFKGVGNVAQWEQYKLVVTLDRDMMINVSALIEDTAKLVSTNVSQETIDNYNPAVENHEIEQARRDAEEEANNEKQLKQSEMFQFGEAKTNAQIMEEFGQPMEE